MRWIVVSRILTRQESWEIPAHTSFNRRSVQRIGGLSGHQGAFRSACLVQTGLTKEQFLGTNVVIACLVDLSRLIFYGTMDAATIWIDQPLEMAGILTPAILGTFTARRYIQTITMPTIRTIIGVFLMIVAIGLATGVL